MRGWLVLVLQLLVTNIWASDEFFTKRTFLRSPQSFVELESKEWTIGENDEQLLVALRFQPKTTTGSILNLKVNRLDGGVEAQLQVSLSDSKLVVELKNEKGELISKDREQRPYLNYTEEYSVAVRINPSKHVLYFAIEKLQEIPLDISEDLQFAGASVTATLGGNGDTEKSLTGCVTLVTIHSGDQNNQLQRTRHADVVKENDVGFCGDQEECKKMTCGEGVCLPLEVATCDCYRTGKSGPNCSNEIRWVELNNEGEDVEDSMILFTPWKEERKIKRIAMHFKFGKARDNDGGVVLYGSLPNDQFLKMSVVTKSGKLIVSTNSFLMNFTLADGPNHYFLLEFDENKHLSLTVDGDTRTADLPEILELDQIVFGASLQRNQEVADAALSACVSQLYVDHYNILDLLGYEDKRVTAKRIHNCGEAEIMAGAKLELPTTIQLSGDEKPSNFDDDEDDESPKDTIDTSQLVHGGWFSTKPSYCDQGQAYICQNGATCMRESTAPKCVCAPGYGGTFCQFSIVPRTCAEAATFYRLPTGPTRLDVDGSKALKQSIVECRYDETIVPHDMPAETESRDIMNKTSGCFNLSYRDFSPSQLTALIAASNVCRQQLDYFCDKAALGFADNRTWFVSASGTRVQRIGATTHGCICADGNSCVNGEKCNCDALGESSDRGVFLDTESAITEIVALPKPTDRSGRFSLGPLLCQGFAGADYSIRFRAPQSLSVGEWNGESLSLQFRTADASGILLEVIGEKNLLVELKGGHTLTATIEEKVYILDSQVKLNDTKWHLLILEYHTGQLRISADSSHVFFNLTAPVSGELKLGSDSRGIVGCMSALLIDQNEVNLLEKLSAATNATNIIAGCEQKCKPEYCSNSGECRENFATNTAECVCRNPRVQSGQNCEIDINKDSSVSFHGGYLMYEGIPSALTESTLLSFRTDQANSLLLYAHDQNANFIQLHLRDEVNLTLSLNNEREIFTCTVQAPPATEYSDMRWIQVSIDHSEIGSQLTIDNEDACTIRAPRKLATKLLKNYDHFNPDIVLMPIGISNADQPYLHTFIGGVSRDNDDGESKVLQATYKSQVPDHLGCIRGLKIGAEVVDLRHTANGYRPDDPDLVRPSCNVGCEQISFCENGGHCSVAWKDYNPTTKKTTCDCSRTSYAGPSCTEDVGITLQAHQIFSFDVQSLMERYIEPETITSGVLKLAFSASKSSNRQIVANLEFIDGNFEILINKNSSVNVGVRFGDSTVVYTFKGNFTDNYRHFVRAQFSEHSIVVLVDSEQYRFPSFNSGFNLKESKLYIGGPTGTKSELPQKTGLQGCISNINYDLGLPRINFWPLSIFNSEDEDAKYARLTPAGSSIERATCSQFRIKNQPPANINNVNLPAWETNFDRRVCKFALPAGEESGGLSWWVILLIILLIILALLVIYCLVKKCCCKKQEPVNQSHDETVPLKQTVPTPPGHRKPTSNYNLPAPDVQLPATSRQQQPDFTEADVKRPSSLAGSWNSATTAYFTAQEDFSDLGDDEDIDRTITPGSEMLPLDDQDLITRPTGFDRTSPQRMSSFRDSTVPINSPLYSPPAAQSTPRRPLAVAPPQPPPRSS